jgi:hypothetical protein
MRSWARRRVEAARPRAAVDCNTALGKILLTLPLNLDDGSEVRWVFHLLRFYVVLLAVAVGIGGLWFASLPMDNLRLPPLPMYRKLMAQSVHDHAAQVRSESGVCAS